MALALDIMKGGVSAVTAGAIQGQTNSAITAAGSSISDATALTASNNVVTTAAASTGVQLPNGEIGDEVNILNLGANAVTVYPPTGSRINAIATSGGFSLATNTAVKVKKFTSTRWMAFLSA